MNVQVIGSPSLQFGDFLQWKKAITVQSHLKPYLFLLIDIFQKKKKKKTLSRWKFPLHCMHLYWCTLHQVVSLSRDLTVHVEECMTLHLHTSSLKITAFGLSSSEWVIV